MYFDRPVPPFDRDLLEKTDSPCWIGDRMPLGWTPGAGAEVASFRTAVWGTPLFDLRPDLRAKDGRLSRGTPVWRAGGLGSGGHLWIMVEGLNITNGGLNTATQALRVRMQEFGHIYDSQLVTSITPQVDVTSDFVQAGQYNAAVVPVYPPGDGYPIRYWRVQITFDKTEDIADPVFTLSGAYY